MEHNYKTFKDAFDLLEDVDFYRIYDIVEDKLLFEFNAYEARKDRPIVSHWSKMEQFADYECNKAGISWSDDYGCCVTFYVNE